MDALTVVLVLVLIVLSPQLFKWFARQRREAEARAERERQEERRRAQEEERLRKEEEARLAGKREKLKRLAIDAEGEQAFLELEYREQYAYQHYDEVRKRWSEQLKVYAEWEADPDFERLALDLGSRADTMVRVWRAKREVKAFADGLTSFELTAWKDRQFALMKEASKRGVSIRELQAGNAKEKEAAIEVEYHAVEAEYHKMLAELRDQLEADLAYCVLMGGKISNAETADEARFRHESSTAAAREQEPEISAMAEKVNIDLDRPEAVLARFEKPGPLEAQMAMFVLFNWLARASLKKDFATVTRIKKAEPAIYKTLQRCFDSDETFAQACAAMEGTTFKIVGTCFEGTKGKWESKIEREGYETLTPWLNETLADYRGRLWKQRTPDDFLRSLKAAAKMEPTR